MAGLNQPPGMEVYSYAIPGMGDGQSWVPDQPITWPDRSITTDAFTLPKQEPCPERKPCVPALADVIDTLNDACKEDAQLFRDLVMRLVKKELGK